MIILMKHIEIYAFWIRGYWAGARVANFVQLQIRFRLLLF